MRRVALWLLLGCGLVGPSAATPNGRAPAGIAELRELQARVAAVIETAAPATLAVRIPPVRSADPARRRPAGAGSAVQISADGEVLTAAHVVERPGRTMILMRPDGTALRARTLGVDYGLDVALARLIDPRPGDAFVPVALPGTTAAGDWVLALGHPGGFDPERPETVRLGRVIRLRPVAGVQSDCALIGGDSGGPLFDLAGRVTGIHTRIGRSGQTNVSASVDDIASVLPRLRGGAEAWGRTGVAFGPHPRGLRAVAVDPNGPAAAAGLGGGWLVIEAALDGAVVDLSAFAAPHDLNDRVRAAGPGAGLKLIGEHEHDGQRHPHTFELRLRDAR